MMMVVPKNPVHGFSLPKAVKIVKGSWGAAAFTFKSLKNT
jgi:hypothetical protein